MSGLGLQIVGLGLRLWYPRMFESKSKMPELQEGAEFDVTAYLEFVYLAI